MSRRAPASLSAECGGERHARGAAGRQANRLAQADDRIEDGAGRVRERAAAADGDGIGERAAPPDEPRAVGLVFGRGADAAAAAEHMNQVHAVGPGPGPARADQRVPLGHGRRFDEQIAERRMREVGGARREHDLGVAGQIEAARPMTVVGDRHAPQLGVVFGRDDDFGARLEAGVDTPIDGAVERERRLVFFGLASRRLVRRRPDIAGVEIADEDEAARRVAGDVLAPACQRELLAPAIAAAGVGQHHGVRAVRQQVGARAERVRRRVEAHRRRGCTPEERHMLSSLARRILQRDELGHALLQQEIGGLNPRVGMETLLHRRSVAARCRAPAGSCPGGGPSRCAARRRP